jgi:hypothetical protein
VYRIVVASTDPGTYNWLDTTGLERGVLILRFCGAAKAAPPTTRLVGVSTVARSLPGARRCTADERRAQLAERREGVAHLILD